MPSYCNGETIRFARHPATMPVQAKRLPGIQPEPERLWQTKCLSGVVHFILEFPCVTNFNFGVASRAGIVYIIPNHESLSLCFFSNEERMGKLLRVLIVFIFVLGAAALFLAYMLFTKRVETAERLKKLEDGIANTSLSIEKSNPPEKTTPAWEERDTDDVTSIEVANPTRNNFWESYRYPLEMDGPLDKDMMLSLINTNDRLQLRKLFAVDAESNKKVIDELTGKPKTDGSGTMQELIDKLVNRARAQYTVLTETRTQLRNLRDEYIKTIDELNRVKRMGRTDKKTIDTLNATIARLEEEKAELNRTIGRLESEITSLNNEITELKDTLVKKEEEIESLMKTVEQQTIEIERLKKNIGGPKGPEPGEPSEVDGLIDAGDKGKVVFADNALKYVVLQLDENFTSTIMSDSSKPLPPVVLSIRRTGFTSPSGEFITRVRLRQVMRDKNLYVADILSDWQQSPVENGDIAFFIK